LASVIRSKIPVWILLATQDYLHKNSCLGNSKNDDRLSPIVDAGSPLLAGITFSLYMNRYLHDFMVQSSGI